MATGTEGVPSVRCAARRAHRLRRGEGVSWRTSPAWLSGATSAGRPPTLPAGHYADGGSAGPAAAGGSFVSA
jgi:hypothetical protein